MAYASTTDVAAMTRGLILPNSTYDASTNPSVTDVEGWLDEGAGIINTILATNGYGVPSAGTDVYKMLSRANALYAAAAAEDSRIGARVSADERTRGDRFLKQFNMLMDRIGALDLGRAGLSQTSVGYIGGRSRSDKDSVNSDSDRMPARFVRGQFRNPEASNALDSAS